MVIGQLDNTDINWLDVIRSGGDASLGDAIIRLAQLAEQTHRAESGSAGGDDTHHAEQRVHGSDPGRVAVTEHDTPARMEVDR